MNQLSGEGVGAVPGPPTKAVPTKLKYVLKRKPRTTPGFPPKLGKG